MLPDSKPSKKRRLVDTVKARDALQFPVPFDATPDPPTVAAVGQIAGLERHKLALQESSAFTQMSKRLPPRPPAGSDTKSREQGSREFQVKVGVPVEIVFFGLTVAGEPGTGSEMITS